MAKSGYLSSSDDGFGHQLQTFKNAIGAYATDLDVTPTQVTAQAADADYFRYVLGCQEIMFNAAKQWTAWKDITRGGGNLPPTGAPAAVTLPTPVAAVAPGVEARFRSLVKQIKANADYNESIGQALGIEGTPHAEDNERPLGMACFAASYFEDQEKDAEETNCGGEVERARNVAPEIAMNAEH